MPKKKKKGGDKEKKAKKKSSISERDTVFFEQLIIDNNRQLARIRTRNEFLEGEMEALKGKLAQLEDDRSDVIAHLKRILQQKTEEARELSERLAAMEDLRKEEQAAFKSKEATMKQEYHNMETTLNAEVKLVTGKLNALDEWKNARAELTQKFEIQEKQMAEQEERHAKTLYEAEKSLIIGKAKMQKETEERLKDLALKFQEATNLRIADATHRAVRENIALHLELDKIMKVCRELEEKMRIHKEREETARCQASLLEKEAEMALEKVLEQNKIIESLVENHINNTRIYSNNLRIEKNAASKEEMIKMYEDEYNDIMEKSTVLEKNIQEAEKSKENIIKEIQDDNQHIRKLNELLNFIKKLISDLTIKSKTLDIEVGACDPEFKEEIQKIYEEIDKLNLRSFEIELT
ncbi:cilia- and flagella-associated protein 157 [Chelonus insularis]|uniref:cilia- and flagella-associated protein 157 n=1 Tax=Chelonus insularis TaxID=460826 RepID=UPI00158CEAD0|nr:cilia- and flagella-associated protein 157 [Chelonus insularis]